MVFCFSPEYCGIYESLWLFSIPILGVQQKILVVASGKEPNVSFANPKLVLSPTLIGK